MARTPIELCDAINIAYAARQSALDDEVINHLIELGDHATEIRLALETVSDKDFQDLMVHLRIACPQAGYPLSEALYPSIRHFLEGRVV